MFALPLVAAALIEAGLSLLADAWERGPLVVVGQAGLAGSLALLACTSSAWALTLGLALAGATSGVACSAAQAILVASSGDAADRALVRWSIFGSIGDVLTPLVTACAVARGHSCRAAMGVVAVVVAIQCVLSLRFVRRARATSAAGGELEPPRPPLRVAILGAVRQPRLWAWLACAASCTLLDEIVVAVAALRLQLEEGSSAATAAAVAVAFSLGAVAGDAIVDGLVERLRSRRILAVSAVLCALAVSALAAVGGPWATCAALFAVGIACAPHHPLAMARAYGEAPENPGTVQALGQLFVVVDVAAPLALGLVADRCGLGAAVGCLVVQPIVVLVCAMTVQDPRAESG